MVKRTQFLFYSVPPPLYLGTLVYRSLLFTRSTSADLGPRIYIYCTHTHTCICTYSLLFHLYSRLYFSQLFSFPFSKRNPRPFETIPVKQTLLWIFRSEITIFIRRENKGNDCFCSVGCSRIVRESIRVSQPWRTFVYIVLSKASRNFIGMFEDLKLIWECLLKISRYLLYNKCV